MTAMTTWIVWSPMPPERLEKICCSSMLDACRGWAERQFRAGLMPRDGTEVLVRSVSDASPRISTYRVRISIVAAPAFRATLAGLAFEGNATDAVKEAKRG